MGFLIIYLIGLLVSIVAMAWLKVNSEFFEEMSEECAPLVVAIVLVWFISWPIIIVITGFIKFWKFLIHIFKKRKEMKVLKEQKIE